MQVVKSSNFKKKKVFHVKMGRIQQKRKVVTQTYSTDFDLFRKIFEYLRNLSISLGFKNPDDCEFLQEFFNRMEDALREISSSMCETL